MSKLIEFALIAAAVASVAIADVCLKKIAVNAATLRGALTQPLLLTVIALYSLQIAIFLYIFIKNSPLTLVGVVQTALYALIVIAAGALFFNERVTGVQGIGILLALAGVILIYLP